METSGKNKGKNGRNRLKNKPILNAWNQGAVDLRTEKKSPKFKDQDSEKNQTVEREQSVETAICNQDKREKPQSAEERERPQNVDEVACQLNKKSQPVNPWKTENLQEVGNLELDKTDFLSIQRESFKKDSQQGQKEAKVPDVKGESAYKKMRIRPQKMPIRVLQSRPKETQLTTAPVEPQSSVTPETVATSGTQPAVRSEPELTVTLKPQPALRPKELQPAVTPEESA